MAVDIGHDLENLANLLGFNLPEVSVDDLVSAAHLTAAHGGTMTAHGQAADTHAQAVADQNIGDDVAAFQAKWSSSGQPSRNTGGMSKAMTYVALGLLGAAAIVTVFKALAGVQLVQLAVEIAQAVATAAVTFGESLLEIPVFKEITQRIVGMLQNLGLQGLTAMA